MKKLLFSILCVANINAFAQWQNTSNYTGKDIYYAFGNVLESEVNTSGLDASNTEGASWAASNTGIPAAGVNFGTYSQGTLYAYRDNNIYKTTTGNNWTVMSTAIASTDAVKSMAAVSNTVLAMTDPVSGTGFKIWQFNGSSWVLRSTQSTTLATCIRNLNGTLWAGTTSTCVLKSNDAGITFTNSSSGMNTSGIFEKYIMCMGATSTALFAGNHMGRMYRSLNNGSTWSQVYYIGNGSSTIDYNDIYITTGGSVLLACDSGFVYSVDNGSTWIKYNAGLNYSVNENQLTRITCSPNFILATTKRSNGSVVRLPMSNTVLGIKENFLPAVESKAYPNPSQQWVTIEAAQMQFEKNCEVRISDVLGKALGTYEMQNGRCGVDVSHFNRGLYNYQVIYQGTVLSNEKLVIE